MITDNQQSIVNALSTEIGNRLNALAMEESMPRLGADASDDLMKQCKKEVEALRKVREDLENIFAGRHHYAPGATT